jgi:predicted dehydrogenase
MKFAILGADDQTPALVQFLESHGDHQIVAVYETEDLAVWTARSFDSGTARSFDPGTARSDWEALLHEPVAEAVVVAAGPDERRGEQLVMLAKAGVPLLVTWPTCDVVAAYELEMIRRDTAAPTVAFIPGRLHPTIARLAEIAASPDSPLGRLEQAVIERAMQDRSRQAVLGQFTRDVALLRTVAGDVNTIGAMGPSAEDAAWSNLNVQMSSAGPVLLRWSMQPPEAGSPGRLILFGSDGKASLEMPAAPQPWTLTISGAPPVSETFREWNEPAAVIEMFSAVFRGESPIPAWQEACRDVEIAAAVQRSLARGKTIELYDDEVSEEATFKGMMAVGGCGLLLLALLAFFTAAVVEGLNLPFREHLLWRLWPVYLLAPIVIFLLLQGLRLVFRPSNAASETRRREKP